MNDNYHHSTHNHRWLIIIREFLETLTKIDDFVKKNLSTSEEMKISSRGDEFLEKLKILRSEHKKSLKIVEDLYNLQKLNGFRSKYNAADYYKFCDITSSSSTVKPDTERTMVTTARTLDGSMISDPYFPDTGDHIMNDNKTENEAPIYCGVKNTGDPKLTSLEEAFVRKMRQFSQETSPNDGNTVKMNAKSKILIAQRQQRRNENSKGKRHKKEITSLLSDFDIFAPVIKLFKAQPAPNRLSIRLSELEMQKNKLERQKVREERSKNLLLSAQSPHNLRLEVNLALKKLSNHVTVPKPFHLTSLSQNRIEHHKECVRSHHRAVKRSHSWHGIRPNKSISYRENIAFILRKNVSKKYLSKSQNRLSYKSCKFDPDSRKKLRMYMHEDRVSKQNAKNSDRIMPDGSNYANEIKAILSRVARRPMLFEMQNELIAKQSAEAKYRRALNFSGVTESKLINYLQTRQDELTLDNLSLNDDQGESDNIDSDDENEEKIDDQIDDAGSSKENGCRISDIRTERSKKSENSTSIDQNSRNSSSQSNSLKEVERAEVDEEIFENQLETSDGKIKELSVEIGDIFDD